MKRWLRQILGLEFPEPKRHNMAIQDLMKFWEKKLNLKWRDQCKLLVYRMDPALAPFPTIKKLSGAMYQTGVRSALDDALLALTPDQKWLDSHPEIDKVVFCVRVQRTWKTEFGIRTEEVCISTFEVSP